MPSRPNLKAPTMPSSECLRRKLEHVVGSFVVTFANGKSMRVAGIIPVKSADRFSGILGTPIKTVKLSLCPDDQVASVVDFAALYGDLTVGRFASVTTMQRTEQMPAGEMDMRCASSVPAKLARAAAVHEDATGQTRWAKPLRLQRTLPFATRDSDDDSTYVPSSDTDESDVEDRQPKRRSRNRLFENAVPAKRSKKCVV